MQWFKSKTSPHLDSADSWIGVIALAGVLLALMILFVAANSNQFESAVYPLLVLHLAQALALWWLRSSLVQRRTQLAQQRNRLDDQLREGAAQEERNRLARDLHDTIKQQLFSINMVAATAQSLQLQNPTAASDCLNEVRTLAQAALSEMKALLTQLRPQALDNVGLVEAIREQLDALHFRADLTTELQAGALPDSQRLPIGAQESLFRAVQESLSNIARHARASHVMVRIAHDEARLTIDIQDNGQGFDPKTIQSGMGLHNISTRLAELGGSSEIMSTPGRGTQVTINVPLVNRPAPIDHDLINRRYNLIRIMGLISTLLGALAVFVFFASTGQITKLIASLLMLSGTVLLPLLWRRLKPIAPQGYTTWMMGFDLSLTVGIGAALVGMTDLVTQNSQWNVAVAGGGMLLCGVVLALRSWALRHSIQEWTTIEKEQASASSIQWTLPFFVVMQLLWLLEHQVTSPFSQWFPVYLSENRFWYQWLLIMFIPVLTARFNIHWLNEFYQRTGRPQPLSPIAPSLPIPVSIRRRRIGARVLTLLYGMIAVGLAGPLAMVQKTLASTNLWLLIGVALALLACKWRVEAWLTEKLASWTTLDTQQRHFKWYQMALSLATFMLLGGLVGGLYAYLFLPDRADNDSTPPTLPMQIVTGATLAWLISSPLYSGLMTWVSQQRVAKLKEQAE